MPKSLDPITFEYQQEPKPLKLCIDCEPGSTRRIKGLKRCATHLRAEKAKRSKLAHEKRVQGVYGLNDGEYDILYASQNNRCALCQVSSGKHKRLAVDHSHDLSGRESVRGLLCGRCNYNLLGIFSDNPEFYLRVYDYLKRPPARKVLT